MGSFRLKRDCLTDTGRYNTDYDVNCVANPKPDPDRPVGPCITSVLDMRNQKNPLEGFVVEDCAVPSGLAPLMFPMLEYLPDQMKPSYSGVEGLSKKAARFGSKLLGPFWTNGSVARTAAYLIMSHDSKSSVRQSI